MRSTATGSSWARSLPAWSFVALLAAITYLPWLAGRSLRFPDEPDVAEPTLTMLATGDWVVPHHNAEPWLDYPPLTYWLGAASSRAAGGWSPMALRLPVALFAVLLVGLTAAVAERLYGRSAGLWSGIALATAPQFVNQAVSFHPDMAFATLVGAGLGSYAHGALRADVRFCVVWKVVGFALLGLAVLAKGPLGRLLPGLILTIWLGVRRDRGAIVALAPLSLVIFAVALPWYFAVASATDGDFVWREVYQQNFARFEGGARGHYHPSWFYYAGRLCVDWGPWSLFLPAAVVAAWRRKRGEPATQLALTWVLVMFAFFSVAATKRQVYLLPAYPAIAILLGPYLASLCERRLPAGFRRLLGAASALSVAVGVGISVLVVTAPWIGKSLPQWERSIAARPDLAAPLLALAAVLTVYGAGLYRVAVRGRSRASLVLIAGSLTSACLVVLAAIYPRLDERKSYQSAAVWLREQAGNEAIGFYLPGAWTKIAGFRVEDPAYLRIATFETPNEIADYLASGDHIVVLDSREEEGLAGAITGWDRLPRREFRLSSRRFVAVGPGSSEEPNATVARTQVERGGRVASPSNGATSSGPVSRVPVLSQGNLCIAIGRRIVRARAHQPRAPARLRGCAWLGLTTEEVKNGTVHRAASGIYTTGG